MDPCHYNCSSSLICHYYSRYRESAITISYLLEICHYVPLRRVSGKFWTKIPLSSTSHSTAARAPRALPPLAPRRRPPRGALTERLSSTALACPWPAAPFLASASPGRRLGDSPAPRRNRPAAPLPRRSAPDLGHPAASPPFPCLDIAPDRA